MFCVDFKNITRVVCYNMLWLCVYSLSMSMKIHFSIFKFRPEPIAHREGIYDWSEGIMISYYLLKCLFFASLKIVSIISKKIWNNGWNFLPFKLIFYETPCSMKSFLPASFLLLYYISSCGVQKLENASTHSKVI